MMQHTAYIRTTGRDEVLNDMRGAASHVHQRRQPMGMYMLSQGSTLAGTVGTHSHVGVQCEHTTCLSSCTTQIQGDLSHRHLNECYIFGDTAHTRARGMHVPNSGQAAVMVAHHVAARCMVDIDSAYMPGMLQHQSDTYMHMSLGAWWSTSEGSHMLHLVRGWPWPCRVHTAQSHIQGHIFCTCAICI